MAAQKRKTAARQGRRRSSTSSRARAPRWLARMRKAQRIVAAATEKYGKERYDLIVEASKIVVALREPRAAGQRLSFQRAHWLLRVAISEIGGCVSGLAMGESVADDRLYARVKRVVNGADPIGLLRAGAPHDEFRPEIYEIARWLLEPQCRTIARTQWIVHRVFVKWFDARVAGPRSAYRALAKRLHELRPGRVEHKHSRGRRRVTS